MKNIVESNGIFKNERKPHLTKEQYQTRNIEALRGFFFGTRTLFALAAAADLRLQHENHMKR